MVRTSFLGLIIAVVLILVGVNLLFFTRPALSAPVLRPTVNPGDGGSGGGSGGGGGGSGGGSGGSSGQPGCASLSGQVINWGFGPEGGIGLNLATGSWQASATSASDGNFGFGGLGVGVATLHVALPPGQAGQLQSLIQDAGVYLNCELPIIANIALYSGERVQPPATLQMTADSTSLAPGQPVEVTLSVKNGLPNDITNVVVTDRIPQELAAVNISLPAGFPDAQVIDGGLDGRLMVADLGRLAAGDEVIIRMTLRAVPNLPQDTSVRNTATLFYRESAADQAWLDFTGGGGLPLPMAVARTATATALPANASVPSPATPEAVLTLPASPEPVATSSESDNFVPPNNMPTTGEDMLLPPDGLPVTGAGSGQLIASPNTLPDTNFGFIMAIVGSGLGGLALVSYCLRSFFYRAR